MKHLSVACSPKRLIAALVVATAVGGGTYGLTASNTVGASRAGDGASVVSGYNVSNVSYTTDPAVPSDVDFVTFTLDAPAGTVKAKVSAASTAYTTCTNISGSIWKCDFAPNVPVAVADQLSVVAAQ